MNAGFSEFLKATPQDRRDVFLNAAARLGTPEQYVEKDFWVTWTLDVLFNGLPTGHPRFLFKGGTSLSKAYGLISRFSEDIDITVFREDLGQAVSVPELEAMSRKKRQARLDAIKNACRDYIQNTLARQFTEIAQQAFADSNIEPNDPTIAVDSDDPDGQSLLFWYPTVTTRHGDYIRPAVKIESGAKSALDPHDELRIVPYVSEDVPRLRLAAAGVTTVVAERTFWDKIIILHGVRNWFERRGVLRGQGQRVSRHYYDAHRIFQSGTRPTRCRRPCTCRGLRGSCPHVLQQSGPRPRWRGSWNLLSVGDRSNARRVAPRLRQNDWNDHRRTAGV